MFSVGSFHLETRITRKEKKVTVKNKIIELPTLAYHIVTILEVFGLHYKDVTALIFTSYETVVCDF